MTNRQTIDELLARLTEDLTEARLEAASVAVRAERERADRHRAEAAAYREILDDVRESLELLAPVPACAIPAQSILDELHRRNLHTHPTDAPVTAKATLAALRTVLDGVDAVFGRVADVGGAVEVPAPVPDAEGWYAHNGESWPVKDPNAIVLTVIRGNEEWPAMRAICAPWWEVTRWRYADGRDVRGGGE